MIEVKVQLDTEATELLATRAVESLTPEQIADLVSKSLNDKIPSMGAMRMLEFEVERVFKNDKFTYEIDNRSISITIPNYLGARLYRHYCTEYSDPESTQSIKNVLRKAITDKLEDKKMEDYCLLRSIEVAIDDSSIFVTNIFKENLQEFVANYADNVMANIETIMPFLATSVLTDFTKNALISAYSNENLRRVNTHYSHVAEIQRVLGPSNYGTVSSANHFNTKFSSASSEDIILANHEPREKNK